MIAMASQRKRKPYKDSSMGYQPLDFNYNTQLTCGNCNYICAGNTKETALRYKTLINSGCVIQREDGCLEVYPPDKAKEEFNKVLILTQNDDEFAYFTQMSKDYLKQIKTKNR